MEKYTCYDKPIKVFGVPFFEERQSLERLPEEVIKQVPHLEYLGRRSVGVRVAFKTDSVNVNIRITYKTMSVDRGMSIYASQSGQVMIGERDNCRYAGLVAPADYGVKEAETTFIKSSEMEQVTLYLPRNEHIDSVEITVDDGAKVLEPTPYKYEKPVVFYGSSITEGGCCCNVTNVYSAILSRWFDFDYYNFGFSGSAKGETEIADFIASLDMSVFVYDYDHNAPTTEDLARTHKPFFDIIREKHPDLPIIMMTRPYEIYGEKEIARREVVLKTYNDAVAAGDKNVYFIDGETYFGTKDRNMCMVDTIHPNDIGFLRMAEVIRPVMEEALKSI